MTDQTVIEILRMIRNHPDPERARRVLVEIMELIALGEDLHTIEATYAADLTAMKRASV